MTIQSKIRKFIYFRELRIHFEEISFSQVNLHLRSGSYSILLDLHFKLGNRCILYKNIGIFE